MGYHKWIYSSRPISFRRSGVWTADSDSLNNIFTIFVHRVQAVRDSDRRFLEFTIVESRRRQPCLGRSPDFSDLSHPKFAVPAAAAQNCYRHAALSLQ